jgi:hypothetical protein
MSANTETLRQAALDVTRGLHVEWLAHERALARMTVEHQPSLSQLIRCATTRGTEGVLEAGMHLSDEEFLTLRDACRSVTTKARY